MVVVVSLTSPVALIESVTRAPVIAPPVKASVTRPSISPLNGNNERLMVTVSPKAALMMNGLEKSLSNPGA
jgi:hypothetical protein